VSPVENGAYSKVEYWDERFEVEEDYEWLASYAEIRDVLLGILGGLKKILVVGNGTSELALKLAEEGMFEVVASDYSEVVVRKMRQRQPAVAWVTADATKLAEVFAASSFDAIVDKAAMDAVVSDEGDPWAPNEETKKTVAALCAHAKRVLRRDGLLVQVSLQQKHFRQRLMTNDLKLHNVIDLPMGLGYFIYVWRRNNDDDRQLTTSSCPPSSFTYSH